MSFTITIRKEYGCFIIGCTLQIDMSKIYLLDCTLRDGGYVNNWEFGEECINILPKKLVLANVDIMELGFIRKESENLNRSVFTSVKDLGRFKLDRTRSDVIYSAMIEGNEKDVTFPVKELGTSDQTGIDLIRVCTWKRLMKEHLDYCKAVTERGYKVSIQPTAIDQYNDSEFKKLCNLTNDVKPFAFYLVDTWGTQSARQIVRYAQMADALLSPDINLGYHGHNNKMQALSCLDAVLSLGLERGICVDATVMGMGRGPGNLQTEVAMDFLNHNYDKNYNVSIAIELYSHFIKKFYDQQPWGYSVYHYISSDNALPQDFASYFKEQGYSIEQFYSFINSLSPQEKVVFKKGFVDKRIAELGIVR